MNRSRGEFVKDQYELIFEGGPLDGKRKAWPYVPIPKFGCRQGDAQFWYVPKEIDGQVVNEKNQVMMVLS